VVPGSVSDEYFMTNFLMQVLPGDHRDRLTSRTKHDTDCNRLWFAISASTTLPRDIDIEYAFSRPASRKGALGDSLLAQGLPAPRWVRQLERNLGRVRSSPVGSFAEGADQIRLIYLQGQRNPLDELARRQAQILVELFRAEQQRRHGHRNLSDLRALAARLLDRLTRSGLIDSVEQRVRTHMSALSSGVSHQYSFIGGQEVDDAYLA
jgi:putative ATP-dependent endonuclease of the OLD family